MLQLLCCLLNYYKKQKKTPPFTKLKKRELKQKKQINESKNEAMQN